MINQVLKSPKNVSECPVDEVKRAYAIAKKYANVDVHAIVINDDTPTDWMGDYQYTQVVCLNENAIDPTCEALDRRWKGDDQRDGHAFATREVDPNNPTDTGNKSNPHLSLIPVNGAENSADWAVLFAVLNSKYATAPAKPYASLKVEGLQESAEKPFPTYSLIQREKLLSLGYSTFRIHDGSVYIDRLVTTYIENSEGAPDPSYRDLNTKQILSFIRFDLRNYFKQKFSRFMLAKDTDYPYPGDVLTPKIAKDLVLARYRQWQSLALVQDPDGDIAKKIRAEINTNNPGELDFFVPAVVMGQLRITRTQIAFRL